MLFDYDSGRGVMHSPHPGTLNPKGLHLETCLIQAPSELYQMSVCRTATRMLHVIDKALIAHKRALTPELRCKLPLDGVLSAKNADLFTPAREFLWRSDELGENCGAAVLSAIGYSLIGLGLRRQRQANHHAGCQICWFRNCVPGSHYCFFHQYSHQRKGRDNPYALRQRAQKIKNLYWPREADLRSRFQFYLIGLPIRRDGWGSFVKDLVVSSMSLKWIAEILLECQMVKTEVGTEVAKCIANKAWENLFDIFRSRFDPYDNQTNLDHWCAKLLEVEAWLWAERQISGQWCEKPVLSRDGRLLRQGQHIAGKRGPKKATQVLMEQAIQKAKEGLDTSAIAQSLGVRQKTLLQWEQRHREFSDTLRFYLKRNPHTRLCVET